MPLVGDAGEMDSELGRNFARESVSVDFLNPGMAGLLVESLWHK